MQITMLYAGLTGLLLLVLSIRIIALRRGPSGPSLGDGGNPDLARRIRAHGNLVEYAPVILLMMALLESAGQPGWAIHAAGIALIVARLMHAYALSKPSGSVVGRVGGTAITLLLLGITGIWCVLAFGLSNPSI
ncbi:MAPEG family protein [Minwuia sp.]|uniref:MAPEG family protein n=1 Tax=Minwuia sp. TaxID=2493630 RepID=UPI003A9197DF